MDPALSARLNLIKHKILVLSGKGGVGKSTVATQLALALVDAGKKVGLVDCDICGPSIGQMLGLHDQKIVTSSDGCAASGCLSQLQVMSIAFMLDNKTDAVIWRGPKKHSMIRQLLADTVWGELDYLIIDTPPGTSDEHISLTQLLGKGKESETSELNDPDGAVLVTTPQMVAVNDVRKEVSFCQRVGLRIFGLVENMSGFVCPCCNEVTRVFSKGGGEWLSEESKIPFLGAIPLDPAVSANADEGCSTSLVTKLPDSATSKVLQQIVRPLLMALNDLDQGGAGVVKS